MKKILIITPHFPPSNLAAVHRSRLFANHLSSFGWIPIILTVDEKYYEEELDENLSLLVDPNIRIEKVKAFKIIKPRLIGDIGVRGFFQIFARAKKLISNEQIHFVYIPIPSFYSALIGRLLNASTGVKYGIDYIDPWVHIFPGSDKIFSRHWLSTNIAKFLEPIAVKKASLITGVAEGYYKGVMKRNPNLLKSANFGFMPYGGEVKDHKIVKNLNIRPYLFHKEKGKIKLVYAGAMLPKAYSVLEKVFTAINSCEELFANVEFHFIGTGSRPNDPLSYNIKPLAEKYGLWKKIVYEYPKRIPYLDVLTHLENCDGIFILGSTEPHYTPSKVYQGVLAQKLIFAVLHNKSSAAEVVRSSHAGIVLDFDGLNGLDTILNSFCYKFHIYLQKLLVFDPLEVDMSQFEKYSAKAVTKILVELLDKTV